jgi:predicted amidophosphoribosyltransferase
MARFAQKLLFDPECWACGSPLGKQRDFCFRCRREMYRSLGEEGFLLRHEGAVTGLLACLRGAAPRTAAGWCFALLERRGHLARWRAEGFSAVLIAPQNRRKQESGLAILGEKVARALSLPLFQPFEKIGLRSQHGRSITGRMDTPCFVKLNGGVRGKVLLIDDVHTTGTTLDQCAYLLRKAGAEEVACFSLARQMMPGFEGKKGEAGEEGEEMDPLLLHLFV